MLDLKFKGYDVFIILAYMVIFTIIFLFTESNMILTIFGLTILFIFPGYLIMLAMYPKRKEISLPERILITIIFSLVFLPSIGLLLNFTPWGIQFFPLLTVTIIISGILSYFIHYVRKSVPEKQRFPPAIDLKSTFSGLFGGPLFENDKEPKLPQIILIFMIIIMLIGIIYMLIFLSSFERPLEKFTELSILDENNDMIEKPLELDLNESKRLKINIKNHEGTKTDYILRISSLQFNEQWVLEERTAELDFPESDSDLDSNSSYIGSLQTTMEMDGNESYLYEFTLNDGKKIDDIINITFQNPGNYQLRLDLFCLNSESTVQPYREVHIIILVT